MKHALPPLTKDLIEALAASAVAWLGRLLGVLLSPHAASHRRKLHRLVQTGERWVEEILFIMAGFRLRVLERKRRRVHARVFACPGFRVSRGSHILLLKSARIRLRGASLVQRVERLFAVLADPERAVAHYMRRLARGLCLRRLVAAAPAAVALAHEPPHAIAFADSS
jgi:hypothetical protein